MAQHDDHRNLQYLEQMFGTKDPHIRDQIALKVFSTKSYHEREDIIQKTDAAIASDDTSLRQKSSLMNFAGKLRTANALMRKVGR
jgi:hypothetical protein